MLVLFVNVIRVLQILFFQRGQTPLHLAAENDHSDVVKMFLKHRPELVTMANTVSCLYAT